MDYRYLKAFSLTAKLLNFSKAAAKLNIAQSAVSRQIKLLEEAVNKELIIRSSKKVLLTDKGKELQLAIENFEQAIEMVFEKESSRTIKVGILHGLLENWFVGILTEYRSKFSNDTNITIGDPVELHHGITEGKYDIIFSTENIQNELVSSLKLFDEKLVLISKKEIDPSKIQDYTWITYSEQNHFFRYYKKRSKSILMVNSITAITQLVRNGVGIAIVPDHILKSNDRVYQYDLKMLTSAASAVYMTTLNFKTIPKHIGELVNIAKK